MARGFTVPTTFKAVDKFSGTVNSMIGRTNKFERRMRNLSRSMLATSKSAAMFGLAVATPLGLAVNEAIKFESAMADVAKVANVSIGSDTFKSMGDDAKSLGINLGISAIEAAGLMQNLAQGGIAITDLNKVSDIAGKVGVAFGITADIAGESFIKTQNALGGTIDQTAKLMDSINMLGNTTAASSEQILTFMASGGSGVARAAGASGESLAAYGSQFISMGKSGEEAATIMERFIRTSLNTKSLRSVFDEAGGGAKGMNAIIEKGAKLSGTAQDKYFKQFGNYGLSIQLMAKNYDQLKTKIDASTDSTLTADSVLKEFENRTNTTGFKLNQAKEKFKNVAITLGESLIPTVTKLMETVTPMVETFSKWVKNNPSTVSSILKITAGVAALSFGVSAVTGVIGGFTKVLSVLGGPISIAVAGIATLYAAYDTLSSVYMRGTRTIELGQSVRERAIQNTMDQQVEVDLLFRSLRKAEVGSSDYAKTLQKIEDIQPGITKQYNLQAGAIENINRAEKALTESIIKRAEAESRSQLLKETVTAKIQAERGPGIMDFALEGMQRGLLGGLAVNSAENINNDRIAGLEEDAQFLANEQQKAINPKKTYFSQMSEVIKEKVEIIINNNSDSEVSTNSSNLSMPMTGITN